MPEEIAKHGPAASALPEPSPGSEEQSNVAANEEVELRDYQSRSRGSSVTVDHEEKAAPTEPVSLTRQSTELGPAVKVPRLKRRGLLGQLTLVAEVEDPKTYSRKMKWFITFIVAVAAIAAPMGSAIFFRKLLRRHIWMFA